MECSGAGSRDKPTNAAPSSGASTPAHHELLDAPNRYANDIQGELVRLGQINRSQFLSPLATGSRSALGSANPSPILHANSALEPRLHSQFRAYEYRPARPGSPSQQQGTPHPPFFSQGMSISTAQLLAPYQARPWARITPGVTPGIPVTPTHHTSQADAYRDYYRPPQPYSPPPMSSSTSCSGFSRSTGAVHDPYTHLPTPVDDTHHTQPLHPHDEDGLRQTSHTRNASLSDGELDETSNYEYMPDGDVDQTSDYGYMSDGELDQTSDNEYMSEGEVRPDTRMLGSLPARPPSARPSADQPADSNSELDVVAVAKERVAGMLKLRDPKLLQSPKFRGLMLLLKCIKFDDPDEIYTHIKSAPLPVASELNVLAQEFKLGMITDACTNAVLSAGASQAAAAVLSNTDSVMSISSVEYAGTQNASVDSDSSPEIDMDTSSDAGYDEAVSQPAPLRAEGPTQLKPLSAGRLPVTSSRDITPSPPPGFSRSRAPSPPSAHPRAARVTTLSSQVQLLSDEEEDGEAKDGQLEEMDSPELVGGTLTTSDQITRTNSPSLELPPVHTPVTKRKLFENTMCAHETDRMVVYVEESSGGSESESGFDSDIEDSSGSALGQQAAGKRARLAGRSQSSTSLASMATASAANAPALAAPQKSSQVLLKAKKDLQAHEAEIARLKLQIKQRQTKALLLKKLQDSKRQQSETLNNSVSAPSTPSTRVVQDNIGDVPAEPAVSDATLEALTKEETKPDVTLDKPCVASAPAAAVKPEVTSDKPYVASASTAAVAQGNSGAETVESAVDDKAPTTPAKAVTKPDIAHVPHSTSHTKAHVARQHNLPNVEYGKLKSELAHAPDDVCKQHLATTAARLDDAIELKRMALRLLARQSPPIGGEAAGAEKKPFAQALARLDARNQRLEAERNELQSHMRRLHATIMLASAEKRVLTYSSDAGSELQAIISSGGSERSPQDLEREIQAIVRLRDNVSKLKEGYEARSDRDSNTNTGPQKAAVATEPPEEASEKPAEKPAVPSVATPAPKPAVVALRAKLASMQVEQSTMSQRLATLAEKRKQGEAATSTFAQPQSKKAKADAGAGTMPLRKDYSASKWTSLRLVLATISQSLGYYSNTHDSWCAMMIESLDSSILQPLTVIDRIGVPGVICPALSFGAELDANKQPTNAVQAAVAHATPNPESTVKGAESRKEYAPYDSVLGGIGAADETTAAGTLDEKPKATEAGSVNLDKLTSRHLLAAIREAPQEFHMGRRYYEDMRRALSIYATDDGDDRISIRNGDLARTLLPVWDKYKHQFPLKHIMAKNLLYKELDLGSITRNSGLGDYASEGKLRPHVFWLVNGYRTSLPVLNRDIALCGKLGKRVKNKKGAKSGKDAKRYFNAANSPDGDTSLDAAGPDTSASNASYRRALSIFGRWRKKLNYRPMAADLNTCLLDVANTDTGQAVLVLGKALEWHPESEKLWDLYLELYTRQKPSEEDVVSAFSDATRFHPHSACIWKRYVVWCGWNATYHAKDAPAGAWLKRLLMVAPMAVKCLASTQTKPRSEGLSAAIAELIIYFWECLWSVHGSAAHMANTDQFSPALLASMRASLLAGSMQALIDEMAGADSNAGTDTQSETPGGAWSVAEWAIADLLLPHHLLCVVQIYLCCAITRQFAPRHVVDRLIAALHSSTSSQATYFIDMDKLKDADNSSSAAVSLVREMYGGMIDLLDRQDKPGSSPTYEAQLVDQSRALCIASINATLGQLRRQQPNFLESHPIKREELFWHFCGTSVSDDDIRSLPGMMTDRRVVKFLLVAMALCANEFPGDGRNMDLVTTALWRHVLFVAKSVGMDTQSFESAVNSPEGSGGEKGSLPTQRIASTRLLYYQIIGYKGTARPKTQPQLSKALQTAEDPVGESGAFRSQIWDNAAIWTNVALVELLYSSIENGGQEPTPKSVKSALLWLRHGLTCLDSEGAGSRAQLWALIIRLTMTQRPLNVTDIDEVSGDIMPSPRTSSIHNMRPCYTLVNFVLQTALRANPSDQTLCAIMQHLATNARSNSELAVRIINYACMHNRLNDDLRGWARQMSLLESTTT